MAKFKNLYSKQHQFKPSNYLVANIVDPYLTSMSCQLTVNQCTCNINTGIIT